MRVKNNLNPASLQTVTAKAEPAVMALEAGARVQFERQGYFFVDPKDFVPGKPAFNRIVPLRDSWAKIVQRG
jgi:glutaminyl-tRNA synthetase